MIERVAVLAPEPIRARMAGMASELLYIGSEAYGL